MPPDPTPREDAERLREIAHAAALSFWQEDRRTWSEDIDAWCPADDPSEWPDEFARIEGAFLRCCEAAIAARLAAPPAPTEPIDPDVGRRVLRLVKACTGHAVPCHRDACVLARHIYSGRPAPPPPVRVPEDLALWAENETRWPHTHASASAARFILSLIPNTEDASS